MSAMLEAIEAELNRHDFAGERGPTSQTGCNDDNWRGVGLKTPDFNRHVAECIVRRIAAYGEVKAPDQEETT